MENKAMYEFDDWVGTVRPDPKNTDQLTVLQGYLGASSEAGHIRIYSDESLNSFVEVPEEAIVHSMKLTPAESSLGGSKLWLRADAVVTFGDPKLANRPKSTFLEGDIMQQYGAFGQPDTTQMAGLAGGQGDTTGRAGLMGGQPDTTGPGVQALATNQFVLCNPQGVTLAAQSSVCLICPVTQPPVCIVLKTRIRSQCSLSTCFQTICGGITRPIVCPPTCFGVTRQFPTIGGCQSIAGCPSLAGCPGTITGPGGTIFQQGAGLLMGQPDTTQMGGYYGTFNPYMY